MTNIIIGVLKSQIEIYRIQKLNISAIDVISWNFDEWVVFVMETSIGIMDELSNVCSKIKRVLNEDDCSSFNVNGFGDDVLSANFTNWVHKIMNTIFLVIFMFILSVYWIYLFLCVNEEGYNAILTIVLYL